MQNIKIVQKITKKIKKDKSEEEGEDDVETSNGRKDINGDVIMGEGGEGNRDGEEDNESDAKRDKYDQNNIGYNPAGGNYENKIEVIFHVHLPKGIEKQGKPVVLGDCEELGLWKRLDEELYLSQPFSVKNPTYWRSNPITISMSNIDDIHYKYAIAIGYMLEVLGKKIVFEGSSNMDNRTLDIKRHDQFDIWKNSTSNELLKYRIFNDDIHNFAFVNYIYNSINHYNLKDKVMAYQHLLRIHSDLTIRASSIEFIIDRREEISKNKQLFLCLLLGYKANDYTHKDLPGQFPSGSLLNAFEDYKQETLPSNTKDQMSSAITTLIRHNALLMQFDWLIIFTIAAKVDPNYTFIGRLWDLKYSDDNLLANFIKELKAVKRYIDVINNFEAYAKLAKVNFTLKLSYSIF